MLDASKCEHYNQRMALNMSKSSITELLSVWRAKYHHTRSRKEKSRIIKTIMESTGYKSSKTIIRRLNERKIPPRTPRSGRRKILGGKEVKILKELWFEMDQPCGKRMKEALVEWLMSYQKEHTLKEETVQKLLKVSAATIDRVLSTFKVKGERYGKRAALAALRSQIPYKEMLRKVESPGYLSADTVAHCGGDMGGDFVWTLTLVDEKTLWCLNRAIWNKGQRATCNALGHLLRELPFRVREINTDNGSEFINYHLNAYLKEHYKTCKQTRSRPYKKNDNARVEERNRHSVRDMVGEDRLGDYHCVWLLNRVYKYHNLYMNHFNVSSRIVRKERDPRTGRIRKIADRAQSPYQRWLAIETNQRRRERMIALHKSLDARTLKKERDKALNALFAYVAKMQAE